MQGCSIEDLEHYHCKDEGCETVFRSSDEGVREHGRNHYLQDNITESFFTKKDPEESEGAPTEYHCKWVSYRVQCFEWIAGKSSTCAVHSG